VDVKGKTFADSVLSLFRELPKCTAEAEWRLFKASKVSSAARVCGGKRIGVVNNGKISNLLVEPGDERCYRATKVACRAWLQNNADDEVRNSAALTMKKSKLQFSKNFGHKHTYQLLASQRSILANHPASSQEKINIAKSLKHQNYVFLCNEEDNLAI